MKWFLILLCLMSGIGTIPTLLFLIYLTLKEDRGEQV